MPKPDGINTIGELFEASEWSINSYFYGDEGWHNTAHDILGSVLMEKDQEKRDVSSVVRFSGDLFYLKFLK